MLHHLLSLKAFHNQVAFVSQPKRKGESCLPKQCYCIKKWRQTNSALNSTEQGATTKNVALPTNVSCVVSQTMGRQNARRENREFIKFL